MRLLQGDCIEKLKEVEDNSVDSVITDPPYGYSFMGKDWDKVVIPSPTWAEVLRVMKPGAFAFIMCAPRQDVLSRLIVNLQDAGFDTGFTSMYHSYATGFPKAQNTKKTLEKRYEKAKSQMCDVWKTIIQETRSVEENNNGRDMSELLEDMEQGTEHCEILTFARSQIKTETKYTERQRQSFLERWSNLQETERSIWNCEICKMPAGLYIHGKKRWICYGTSTGNGTMDWTVIDEDGVCSSYKSQHGKQQKKKPFVICDECLSQKVRGLGGSFSGYQPKPAVEVVLVVKKPSRWKTYLDGAMDNGKGITWLGDCRIPYKDDDMPLAGKRTSEYFNQEYVEGGILSEKWEANSGRFPANLIVSDDILNDSFSRFFSLDAWAEKNLPFLIVPKASKREKNEGLGGMDEKQDIGIKYTNMAGDGRKNPEVKPVTGKNNHPTIKPIKLMSYLITMGSRKGDVILDPFMGSGTTGVAAKMLGREFIGVEMSEEYMEIAKARIGAVKEELQDKLFEEEKIDV